MTRRERGLNAAALAALLLASALPLSSCSTWNPQPTSAEPGSAPRRIDGTTRVTLRSGKQVMVEYPTIGADSLRGFRVERIRPTGISGYSSVRRSHYVVATADVVRVELKKPDPAGTVILLLGIIGGTILVATIPWWASSD